MTKKQSPADGGTSNGAGSRAAGKQLATTAKPAEQALVTVSPRLPTLPWAQVLADVDLDNLQTPPDMTANTDITTLRELVTPAMRAALPDWKQRVLDRLASDAEAMTDPLASPLFCGRMLSATIFEDVQKELVVDAVASVLEPRMESYDDAADETYEAVREFADDAKNSGRTARPIFEHEEYERIAHFVRKCSPVALQATSEREFYADGKPVATATINAFVHNVLSRCQLYSARAHDAPATINNRLIAEVRAALARIVHQAPAAATPAPMNVSSVTAFCDRCMRLDQTERERTPSTLMYEQWLAQCSDDERLAWSEATFIRQVRQWAKQRGGRLVDDGRSRHMGKFVTWYRGVVLLPY